MPPNATADSNARLNDTYDPLLNFSYYPSGSNFSTDFTGNNFYGGVGGLATDANNYASKDYRSGPSASWLQGDDFLGATGNNNLSSNYLNPETSTYIPNLSSVNLDQIKIVRERNSFAELFIFVGRPDDGKCIEGFRFWL